MTSVVFEQSPPHEVIEVTESPRDETKTSDAEQAVQDLRVDLDPYLSSAIDVVTGWVAHGWCGIEKNEEDHGSPAYHIQTVDRDKEPEWCEEEFPERLQSDCC